MSLENLKPIQRKFMQKVKDTFDDDNSNNNNVGYIFAELVKHPELSDRQVFHILGNTISKDTNDLVLTTLLFNQQSLNAPEPDLPDTESSYVVPIESIKSNAYELNPVLKSKKAIRDIVCEMPASGMLQFYIKLEEVSDIKTLAIRFADGNLASYKFEVLFFSDKNKIISEVSNQRNSKVTSLVEFYELENIVEGVDRIVLSILDKYNEHDISDNTIKISEFLMSNDTVSEEMKNARIISAIDVQNKESKFDYLNHPSLLKLRVSTNESNYPTLYEIQDSVSGAINNDKYVKVYNVLGQNNIISTTPDEPILLRIGNPNTARFSDEVIKDSLSTLKLKGCMKYGAFKNKFIAFKIIPLEFDKDTWSIDLVTRGGEMEEDNKNLFHAIVQMNALGFSFNRQLIENKADVFIDEVQPAFDIKLRTDEEIGIVIYQYNLNENAVQYYIYVKQSNDIEWKLYNAFVDDNRLVGENYGAQPISWGGLYDYIFFRDFTKMKVVDLSVGELVTPIRKVSE
jgi:hypothetical protein